MTTIGALRWPASNPTNQAGLFVEESSFLRTRYAYREPRQGWAFNGLGGGAQAQADQDLEWAKWGGIDYFAYDWYPMQNPPNLAEKVIMEAHTAHVASTVVGKPKAALIIIPNETVGTGYDKQLATYWTSTYVPWFVTEMQRAMYQTVTIAGVVRPLVFAFGSDGWADSRGFGSVGAANTRWTEFRNAAIAGGLNNPYIVEITGQTTLNFDAVSGYGPFNGAALPANGHRSWEDISERDEARRETVPSGWGMVPPVTSCSDPRPRRQSYALDPGGPWAWAGFYEWYADHPTYRQWEDHLTATLAHVDANPSSCPADTVLIYGWEENEEAGRCLVPGLPDDDTGKGFMYLDAVRNVKSGVLPDVYVDSYNGDHASLVHTGAWSLFQGGTTWNGDVYYTLATNADVSLTTNAIGFEVWGDPGPDRGIIEVYLDGVSQGTVDLYEATNPGSLMLWSRFGLTPGVNHTLRLRNTGTANALNVSGSRVFSLDVIHATCRR